MSQDTPVHAQSPLERACQDAAEAPLGPLMDMDDEAMRAALAERHAVGRSLLRPRVTDPLAFERVARILAILAGTIDHYSVTRIAHEWQRRGWGALDEQIATADLDLLFHAGLVDFEEANDGDCDGPGENFWPEYATYLDDAEQIHLDGARAWLRGKLGVESPEAEFDALRALEAAARSIDEQHRLRADHPLRAAIVALDEARGAKGAK